MAAINPMIDEKELKHDLLKSKPEGMFVVYDEMMDDLIIKLVRPETFTSLYHLNDEIALIVDPITLQIVGFHIFDFQKQYIDSCEGLGSKWYEEKLADFFAEYKYITLRREGKITRLARRSREVISCVVEQGNEVLEEVFA